MKIFNNNVKTNRGMTYVELIVVLSIFSIISSIMMFNYGSFQAKVDIKNLASDIALRLTQAQEYSVSGRLPSIAQQTFDINTWRPSYGVYFNTTTEDNKKSLVYFTDINQDGLYDSGSGELVEKISINKGNSISKIEVMDASNTACSAISELTVSFMRPNSGAKIIAVPDPACVISYAQITVSSSNSTPIDSKILIYSSGRIQIN